jgi:phosphoribosylaminoimidazole-succinocarboxamide synthase
MLTIFWLTEVLKSLSNHLVAWGRNIYDYLPDGMEKTYLDLHYRTLVVRNLGMVPFEFIFRGYLTGSLLKNYPMWKRSVRNQPPARTKTNESF